MIVFSSLKTLAHCIHVSSTAEKSNSKFNGFVCFLRRFVSLILFRSLCLLTSSIIMSFRNDFVSSNLTAVWTLLCFLGRLQFWENLVRHFFKEFLPLLFCGHFYICSVYILFLLFSFLNLYPCLCFWESSSMQSFSSLICYLALSTLLLIPSVWVFISVQYLLHPSFQKFKIICGSCFMYLWLWSHRPS